MANVLIRTVLIYIILELSMKLMGKRQIAEFQLSELVTTLLLSELAALPIADPDIPLLFTVFPISLIIALEVISSYASLKSDFLRRFFCGKPSIIICRGKLIQSELSRQRVSLNELLAQLRENGIGDINDVEYAIIEDDGKFSVIPKTKCRPPAVKEMQQLLCGQSINENGIAHSLVVDGKIIYDNLTLSGKTPEFVKSQCKKSHCSVKDVLLLSCDDGGNVNLIKKERGEK